MGYNVNVAWTGGVDPPIGDVEYLTAFRWGLRRAWGRVEASGPCRGRGRKHTVWSGWRGRPCGETGLDESPARVSSGPPFAGQW